MSLDDFKKNYKKLQNQTKSRQLITEAHGILTNAHHHRNMNMEFRRAIGEALNDDDITNAEFLDMCKAGNANLKKMEQLEKASIKLQRNAQVAVKSLAQFAELLKNFIQKNRKSGEIKDIKKLCDTVEADIRSLKDEVTNELSLRFQASDTRASFDKEIKQWAKKNKEQAKKDASANDARDRKEAMLRERNILTSITKVSKIEETANSNLKAADEKVTTFMTALKNRPKERQYLDITKEIKAVDDGVKEIEKMRSVYARELKSNGPDFSTKVEAGIRMVKFQKTSDETLKRIESKKQKTQKAAINSQMVEARMAKKLEAKKQKRRSH